MAKEKLNEKANQNVDKVLLSEKEQNHSNYKNAEDLEINTLENAVYLSMKNDLSFIFDMRLYIFEHQSTYCPNIPLRDLHYVSALLEGMIPRKYIYSTKLIKIPAPHFVVFYNGEKEMEDRTILRLSDAFEKPEEHPDLELKVTMINVNYGRNTELMEVCKDLRDYSMYVQKVRTYAKTMDIRDAVEKAVKECIENGILEEILTKFRAEVEMISITEYDKKLHEQTLREDGFEDGFEDGREIGREEGREEGELKNLLRLIQKKMMKEKTYETIAEELETDLAVVEQIGEEIKNAVSNSTQEELVKILMEKNLKLDD
ncbi:MAG: hypothetical protein IJA10_01625 [Lachnospiraceae bacterium]|nr:hypothetical protein [Lachnospiraceae bacterium]